VYLTQCLLSFCNRAYLLDSFFIHKGIGAFADDIVAHYGLQGQQAMLFPSPSVAMRCLDFIQNLAPASLASPIIVLDLALDISQPVSLLLKQLSPRISAVIYPPDAHPFAKQYWQHTGDGVSSRRAEFCHRLFKDRLLVTTVAAQENAAKVSLKPFRGLKRYQRPGSIESIAPAVLKPIPAATTLNSVDGGDETQESSRFLEERFGRNLDLSFVEQAKSAIKRRIAGAVGEDGELAEDGLNSVTPYSRGHGNLTEDDIYLFPTGMNSIFTAHRALLKARANLKSINFGFPYVDTLKILQKFGPGCIFYGNGSDEDLDDLERKLQDGERFLALFCEFPGNPLLRCPNLTRIRGLADEYDFSVVVDETIGTFGNINVLPAADIVVSSLTKIFSGDSNVMGGGLILNPDGKHYGSLRRAMGEVYEDTYWPEDVVFMERNSRDFLSRIHRINANAEAICEVLQESPAVRSIYYPKLNSCRSNYDTYRLSNGGYGGLLSIVFKSKAQAQSFYDDLDIAKGPSLGTNFTLCSPYVLLAHYQELPWTAQFGVDPDLVRVSVGLEVTEELQATFRRALKAASLQPAN
jgi:cystathionine gamma-synthase